MRTCPSCGQENPLDRDFCASCGEYLRWEPTGVVPAVAPDPVVRPAPDPPAAPARSSPGPSRPAPPPPGRPPPPARAPEPAAATAAEDHEAAVVVLRAPDGEPAHGEALAVSVEPAGRARVLALIRNQSRIVDNYDIRVEGLPEGWWSVIPAMVYLTPFGSGGAYEQEVEVHLHPPRAPDAEARVWDLRVVADSRASGGEAAAADLALEILPYTETSTTLRPQRKKGRRGATYDVDVRNQANADVLVALEGSDADGELEFGFNAPPQEIGPGRSVTTAMRVRAPRRMWVGRPVERRFEVITITGNDAAQRLAVEPLPASAADGTPPARRFGRRAPAGAGAYAPKVFKPQVLPPAASIGPGGVNLRAPQFRAPRIQAPKIPSAKLQMPQMGGSAAAVPQMPSQAVFVQKPMVRWWVPPVLLFLAVAAVAAYVAYPRTVEVPNLVGARSIFEAQAKLEAAKLQLDPNTQRKRVTDQPPGSVIGQSRPPGSKVAKNTRVGIQLAVGSGTAKVPRITGLTLAEADTVLRRRGLTLGPADVAGAALTAKVANQVPRAGEPVRRGTPVSVFFAAEGGKAGPGAKPTPTPGVKKAGKVPSIAPGMTAAAATAALAKEGITPKVERAVAAQKAGTVTDITPNAGASVAPGDEVTLGVSLGEPQLAYDDGKHVFLVNGVKGTKLRAFTKGAKGQEHPTWSADGKRLAYASGGQVIVKDVKAGGAARPLTPADTYTDLAWAPTTTVDVLAMAKGPTDSRELCVGEIAGDRMTPDCKGKAGLTIGRAIHWSPDGRTLLAFGKNEDKKQQGIVRWRSETPFSARRSDWGDGRFVSDVSDPARFVADAAISPDGKMLALIANVTSPFFQVYLTAPNDFRMNADPQPLGVRGCKVAWRSDSKAVAVAEGDAACAQGNGAIRAVPIDDPNAAQQLSPNGSNPAFQPLAVEG